MIYIFQVVTIFFSFFMIYIALLNYRRKELSLIEIIVWSGIWIFVIVTVVFPDPINTFAKTFLFARLFDLMMLGAIIITILMAAKSYISVRKIEKKLEEYIRHDAIKSKGKM